MLFDIILSVLFVGLLVYVYFLKRQMKTFHKVLLHFNEEASKESDKKLEFTAKTILDKIRPWIDKVREVEAKTVEASRQVREVERHISQTQRQMPKKTRVRSNVDLTQKVASLEKEIVSRERSKRNDEASSKE